MNIPHHRQNLIDAYLRDELTEEMRQHFENLLATDEVFKEEFIFQQSLLEATALDPIKEAMEQARTDNLLKNKDTNPEFEIVRNSIETARTKNKKRKQRRIMKMWLIRGAVAACVLFTGFWAWTNHIEKNVDKELLALFDATDWQGSNIYDKGEGYHIDGQDDSRLRSMTTPVKESVTKPVPDDADKETAIKDKLYKIETTYLEKRFNETLQLINDLQKKYKYRSEKLDNYRAEIIKHKLEEIETAYHKKRFDETFRLIENLGRQLSSGNSLQPVLRYYKANLYAQTEDYTKSIGILKPLTRQKSDIEDDARWLLGLSYLKINEKAKAKREFKILAEASEKYKEKAQQKLKKHYFL